MAVLVTGGAGYIGSHMVQALRAAGREVVVLDDLSRGNRGSVPDDVPLHEVDVRDLDATTAVLREHEIEAVLHFAAVAYVAESVAEPLPYYSRNVAGSIRLLEAMRAAGVRRIVFSSTCMVYGDPTTDDLPIRESLPLSPVNPYGWSKRMVERALADEASVDPEFGYTALRYFNVAGCAADGSLGEIHDPETHVIPLLLLTALGRRERFEIRGTDFPTADGTCVRDYIHVEDLCDAHLRALDRLEAGTTAAYNLANGRGYSVREVVESVRRVTGREFEVVETGRRPGDPPALYADATLARRTLGWSPRYTELDDIVATAWAWFREHR